eukprot:TRINITY_DN59185_c0_g1_i1.p1 TRINITY_DN59185_c0_g1~~TRINITY_DN59185_c0_g1_i1.p1  ORF type:complete len:412 (+),score=155.12 TRINITY_DN59185_c0_g1_i1:139-1236(+)
MGWMSWEIFRCNIDCAKYPDACINEQLYKAQTDALVSGGFAGAGYNSIHIDDCWMNKTGRGSDGKLSADTTRFPSGMKALGDYMHAKNVNFGLYTAESPNTCAGYPASKGYEKLDAETFASWGVDYMKVDGCGDASYYPVGYPAMGEALKGCGRDIVYSCSWPAYLGSNESTKPFDAMISSHCNLWRNYADIQCNWNSLANIIAHWGQYGEVIAKYAAPGHWNDPDMLLIGNDCITVDEAKTQMAIWSIVAAPLIMGNDLRNVSAATRDILLNEEVIAVNQDSLGSQGVRTSVAADGGEVWMRKLSTGHAFVLYNPTSASLEVTVDLTATPGKVRDLWTKADVGKVVGTFGAVIPSHGASIYTVV